jgi:hypothetical protein
MAEEYPTDDMTSIVTYRAALAVPWPPNEPYSAMATA